MLTMKGKYGLKAMVHLAGCEPGRPEQVMTIAAVNGISKKFLDAILGELRVAGLVASKKGKGGGYALAKPAHAISVGEIIRILDGPLAPVWNLILGKGIKTTLQRDLDALVATAERDAADEPA